MTDSSVIRVLCMEDDADSCVIMMALLGEAGYEAVTAETPAEGLELARRGGFDLIILDNWYERGSGVELCRKIREFDAHTPIPFFSGAGSDEEIKAGVDAGAQGYLVKPHTEDLAPAIASLISETRGELLMWKFSDYR